jgi:hypothetical protein
MRSFETWGGARSLAGTAADPAAFSAGYRTDPRTTRITRPGCYAFEVVGLGFSELIVFEGTAPGT